MTEAVLYVTLFLALYFQVFALLTFVSRDARLRREKQRLEANFPKVAVIAPCWNEETTIAATADSLQALDYPKDRLEIILVNDGSTDETARVLEAYAEHPNVTVIHKENGGKHSAINCGITHTNAEFIGCLDANSFVHPGALKEILPHFEDRQVAAVTASMTVHEPKNILQEMQYAEYLTGVALRYIFATVNGLYVTPGPFSFYRREVLNQVGGFRHGHQTEDMEMAMRLQKHGYKIENAPRAQVYTKAPGTIWGLIKQRTRWTTGFVRNSYDYRSLILNPKHGVLGLLVMPLGIAALIAGMSLFVVALADVTTLIMSAVATQGDVPWSFALEWPQFDWFYAPLSGIFGLGVVGVLIVTTIMFIGKNISGATKPITRDIIWYLTFYSLIAPFWIFRTAHDVARGRVRAWR